MKKALLIAGVSFGLFACNDDNTSSATDTVADSTHHVDSPAESTSVNTGTVDTAGMSGKSMMTLMQANMNQMMDLPSTGNPDNDFAAFMKIHHMGALDMAQYELAKGTDPLLKKMAQRIIDDQQKEIAKFNTFLSGHTPHGGGDAFYKAAMGQMRSMKMEMDHAGSVDKQFAAMMILHHQGAIDMSNIYLKNGGHEAEIQKMANTIIASQQKEIAELQAWLNKNK
jgi:uncharacterized protein (DUF305 family)